MSWKLVWIYLKKISCTECYGYFYCYYNNSYYLSLYCDHFHYFTVINIIIMIIIIIDKPTPLSLWDWRALNSGNKMILKGELQFKKWRKKAWKRKKRKKIQACYRIWTNSSSIRGSLKPHVRCKTNFTKFFVPTKECAYRYLKSILFWPADDIQPKKSMCTISFIAIDLWGSFSHLYIILRLNYS